MRVTRSAARLGGMLLGLGLWIAASQAFGDDQSKTGAGPALTNPVAMGYEIFNREWMPNDPRGHGGDGLGPVYNDSSCIACHNSGGSGGAGPINKNIDILSAARNLGVPIPAPMPPAKGAENTLAVAQSSMLDVLDPIHPGFRTARNVVLHKFGTDPNYDAWRNNALATPQPTQFSPVPQMIESTIAMNAPRGMIASTNRMDVRIMRLKAQNVEPQGDSRALGRIQQIQAAIFASNPRSGSHRSRSVRSCSQGPSAIRRRSSASV